MTAMASRLLNEPFVQAQMNENIKFLAFSRGIHRSPVNSLHKGSVTRKMSPFDNLIMVHAHACEMS